MIKKDGTAVLCQRISEGARFRQGEAGWLHELTEAAPAYQLPAPELPTPIDAAAMARECQRALTCRQLSMFAERLGLVPMSLRRFDLGWSAKHQAYTFPMRDAQKKIIGIRLRNFEGRKWAVMGSRSGLFVPCATLPGPTLICEGPTDSAALLGLGFNVVGRPSCSGGVEQICGLLAGTRDIVIVADADGPGQDGARTLRDRLGRGRIVTPPAKDARAWVIAGATRLDVKRLIGT